MVWQWFSSEIFGGNSWSDFFWDLRFFDLNFRSCFNFDFMSWFNFNFKSCFFLDLTTCSAWSFLLFLSSKKMLECVALARQEWLKVASNNCSWLCLDPANIPWIDANILDFKTGTSSKRVKRGIVAWIYWPSGYFKLILSTWSIYLKWAVVLILELFDLIYGSRKWYGKIQAP